MIFLTTFVLFLVYLNAPAVAVRVHGAPFVFAAAVPMVLAVPVAHRVLIRGEPLRFPLVLVAAIALLAVQLTSAIFSERPFESLDQVETWALEGVLLALLIANAVRTRDEVRASALAVVAAGAVMGTIACLQQALGPADWSFAGFGQLDSAIVDGRGRVAIRLAGPIGETNRFAQIMAVLLPIGAGIALAARGFARGAAWLAVALIAAGMAFAFSRGVIVALGLAVPVALAIGMLRWRQLALAGLVGLVMIAAMPHYAERVLSIGTTIAQTIGLEPTGIRNADGAVRGRLTEMKSAGLLFLEHPVLGAGPGMAPYAYERHAGVVGGKVRAGTRRSHNLYLQLASETGIVGLAAFAFVIVAAFRELERARLRFVSNDRALWGIVCGLELALVISLTSSLFLHAAYVRYFWVLIGLATAASAQSGAPALAAFLSRALRQTAERLRADEARA